MKGTDILKWGFVGWLAYKFFREFIQPHSDINHDNPVIQIPSIPKTLDTMYPTRQPAQPTWNSLTNPEISRILEDVIKKAFGQTPLIGPSPPSTKPVPDLQIVEAGNWIRLIPHPCTVLILGKRGGGKSALGYRLLECLRWTASSYVVGLPVNARKLLPYWVGMATSLEEVPTKVIVLVDEAYMPYHARSSLAAEAKSMSQMVNLSRQREQTLIFVSQEARQLDRNIVSSANVMIFKDLGILQLKFERRELNDIATSAKQAFATITGDKRGWAYVYSPDTDFMGLMENSLPTFWTKKLSHIFAAGGEAATRSPKKMPRVERIKKAKELKQQELSLGQISKILGMSKATIKNYLDDYPYNK